MTFFFLILAFFALIPFNASFPSFDFDGFDNSANSMENRRTETINKCCPNETHQIYGPRTMFCCLEGLFLPALADVEARSRNPPLEECFQNGDLNERQIVNTVHCAQSEFHGRHGVDICKLECCGLFENVDTAEKETECSRKCISLMQNVETTRRNLFRQLGPCRRIAEIQFRAFQHCIRVKDIADKSEEQTECSDSIDMIFDY